MMVHKCKNGNRKKNSKKDYLAPRGKESIKEPKLQKKKNEVVIGNTKKNLDMWDSRKDHG